MNTDTGYLDPRTLRRELGLNQLEFWSRVGVTQSSGSFYERGRRIPKSVQELVRVVHIERIDLSQITREEIAVLSHLRAHFPDLYEKLRDASQGRQRRDDNGLGASTELQFGAAE